MHMKLLNYFLIGLLQAFRPLLGPACCKFPIGCTQYAIEQLKKKRLHKALWVIAKRILSCF